MQQQREDQLGYFCIRKHLPSMNSTQQQEHRWALTTAAGFLNLQVLACCFVCSMFQGCGALTVMLLAAGCSVRETLGIYEDPTLRCFVCNMLHVPAALFVTC
jgi:hypothetical protein